MLPTLFFFIIPLTTPLNISNIIQYGEIVENNNITINKKYDLLIKECQNPSCDTIIKETIFSWYLLNRCSAQLICIKHKILT